MKRRRDHDLPRRVGRAIGAFLAPLCERSRFDLIAEIDIPRSVARTNAVGSWRVNVLIRFGQAVVTVEG